MDKNNIVQRCDFRMHDIIDEKYRVERVLNNNLNDQKFKVIDSEGNEYILKLLKLWEVNPKLQQAMSTRSESEIASCRIKSAYLSQISNSGMVNGNPYVTINWTPTTELSRLVRSPRINVVSVAKQILYGLRDLHKSGKVHCMLTPENILVTNEGNVLLTNFIILGDRSKTILSMNKSARNPRQVNKAHRYAAPEFFLLQRNATILPTSDIYSFGVILFQLLTGELPFGTLNTETDWIRYQGRISAGEWNRSLIPRNVNRSMWMKILEGCLAENPSGRFGNVDEILRCLPDSDDAYKSMDGNQINAPIQVQHGVLLRQMQGDEYGRKYRLSELFIPGKHIVTVGRECEEMFNTLVLKEGSSNYISRHHCTIEWDEETDTWYVRDGQWEKDDAEPWHRSLNGTYVNSMEIDDSGCKLVPGDIISIGDIKLRVEGY